MSAVDYRGPYPAPIWGVAMRRDGKIWMLPKPNRRHHLFQEFPETRIDEGKCEQGFVDAAWKFLSREEAVERALATGQIEMPKKTHPQYMLFSEDLW